MSRRRFLLSLPLFVYPALAQAQPFRKRRAYSSEARMLEGRWLLTMPAGFEYDAVLEPAVEYGLLRLKCGATNHTGLYEVRGNRLVVVQPENLYLRGLAWEVKNKNSLVLVEQPNTAQVGSDYRGATLGRQKSVEPKN